MAHGQNPTIDRIAKVLLASVVALGLFSAPTGLGAAEADETKLSVAREADGAFRVHGEFTVLTSAPVAWDVLTDYANLPSFVSSMRSSVVTARDGDGLTVMQHGVGKVGPFTRSMYVTLQVVEKEPSRIEFHDVSGRTFASYSGSWAIAEIPGGVQVTYGVRVLLQTPPPVFGRSIVGKNARHLLDQVRLEMARRGVRTASR